jgi:hypothetical protein
MQLILSALVLTLSDVTSPGSSAKTEIAVPVVKVAIDGLALKQLTSASPLVGCETPVPVVSLEKGLPYARKALRRPILAMSESKGWFVYATSVVREKDGPPVFFLSGCAIKRGGRQVIHFSVW